MKTHYLQIANLLLAVVLLCACTNEVEDAFDQSASIRLQSTIDQVKTVLKSADYGWELEYYAGSELTYGGTVFILKFDGQTVSADCSLLPGQTSTSLYKVTNDQGPILSFDTYNPLLHYYSTPSGREYEAKGGDFEFVVDSVGADRIKLIGKKSHNTMYMRRLQASADDYATQTIHIFDHFVDSIQGTIAGVPIKGKFDLTSKSLMISSSGDTTVRMPFAFNNQGLRFYRPIMVNGQPLQTLLYDPATKTFTSSDPGFETLQLQGIAYPSDYMSFSLYEGDYSLVFDGSKRTDVSLVANRLEGNYRLKGLSRHYDLVLNYHPQSGTLTLGSQQIGEVNGNPVYFVCYDVDQTSGGLSLIDEQQFTLTWNKNRFYPSLSFSATHPNLNNCNSGLLIYVYYTEDNSVAAALMEDSEWTVNGSPLIQRLKQMNKKSRIEN